MRAIFFGTPEFAVPCLSALAELPDMQVVQVVTQPDRPSGRGMKLTPPPVKVRALELGVPVMQPSKVRTPEFAEALEAHAADVALVVAYGRILTPRVLGATRLGAVNVHASLLPKLRGAAPIQWSIVRGETQTGVCLMQMDEGMDTGAVLDRASLDIGPDESAAELSERLSTLGAALVRSALPKFLRGELQAVPQDHAHATLAPVLKKEDGLVAWDKPALDVHNLVRGMNPWPGAYSFLEGARVKVHRTKVVQLDGALGAPGVVLSANADGITVACGQGAVLVTELQLEGARRLAAGAFVAGRRLPSGAAFTMAQP